MVTIKTVWQGREKHTCTLSFSDSDVEVDSKGTRWLPRHAHIVLRVDRACNIAEMSRRNFVARVYAYEATHVTVLGLDPRWVSLDADLSW